MDLISIKSKSRSLLKVHSIWIIKVFDELDYGFSENGLMGFKKGELFHKKSILDQLGNEVINKFVSFCIRHIADLDIPVKRGTFVEYRNGMINVSPIGRNCSQSERDEFEEYDKVQTIILFRFIK